jgi:hypothetical protein
MDRFCRAGAHVKYLAHSSSLSNATDFSQDRAVELVRFCGSIKLADEVSAWIAAWRRASASKLARPEGW